MRVSTVSSKRVRRRPFFFPWWLVGTSMQLRFMLGQSTRDTLSTLRPRRLKGRRLGTVAAEVTEMIRVVMLGKAGCTRPRARNERQNK